MSHQLLMYNDAATTFPRRRRQLGPVGDSATQVMTTASMTTRAGSNRRARRIQKFARPRLPGLAPVLEQQVGDQITAQGEEHPDAEQASLGPSDVEVVDDHGQDREGPQPVEAGDISMPCFGWSRQSTTRGTVPGLLRRGPDWDDGDHR